ncbi:MAG: hypothetical protein QG600_668 [Patescibacteria group bacterium]|jgi:hypothetical protein|nr:hypothetical protein [Patescibacteria group bacterium]
MFSAKKLLLIGFFLILLIAIPVTIYFVQQQQEIRSQAQAASTLAFTPPSSQANPMLKNVGDVFGVEITVDPSTNLVSFVRLEIQYDSTKLATASAEGADAFVANNAAFPSINEGPIYEDGKILVTLSVGSDPTKAIQTLTRVGTITFEALETTDTPTLVTYGVQTQVLSIGGGDQASENVLSTTSPAAIQIGGESEPSPTVTEEPTPTDVTPTVTLTPTVSPTATTTANVVPVCTSFTPSVASGSAPLAVTFTTIGNDTDGTIDKISYNFGDGTVTDITEGLAAANIENQTTHTYTSGGTFSASAVLTDDDEDTSTITCSTSIIVAGPSATPSATMTATATPTVGANTPTPTMEDPGPGATIIGLGAFFTVLSLVGAVLFFAL